MPQLIIPKGLRGDSNTPKQVEVLKDCYYEAGDMPTLVTRPVSRSTSEGIGRCRGSGSFKDELYHVSNDRLIKITLIDPLLPPTESNIAIDNTIGQIVGEANCVLVSSFTQLMVVVQGGAIYVYDPTNGLREITDPQIKPAVSATFDSGNFVLVPSDGDPFFWGSDVNIQADPNNIQLEFADAEEFTDLNKSVITRKQQIFVGGSRSVQRFQFEPTANSYVPIGGTESNYGYVGGLTDYGDTFMFLGQGANGGFSFFVMGQKAAPVGSKAVDEILSTYDLNELGDIVGETFRWESQDIAVFYLPNHTLVYYGDFALWYGGTVGNGQATWNVSFMQLAYGFIWTGNIITNTIGILTNDDNEDGKVIEGEIQTYFRSDPRSNIMIHRIWLMCNPGINVNNQSIGMQVSRNGLSWGPMRYRSLGVKGDTNKELSWGSPVIKSDHHVGIRFRWTGNIRLACDQVYFE